MFLWVLCWFGDGCFALLVSLASVSCAVSGRWFWCCSVCGLWCLVYYLLSWVGGFVVCLFLCLIFGLQFGCLGFVVEFRAGILWVVIYDFWCGVDCLLWFNSVGVV